jgi:hypothetical protein
LEPRFTSHSTIVQRSADEDAPTWGGRENAATADLGGGRAAGGGATYTTRGKGIGRPIAVGRLGHGEGGRGRALP